MRYAGVLLIALALGLSIGSPALERPVVGLYIALFGLLAIGAVAPVGALLELAGWRDPAKRMLAGGVIHLSLAAMAVVAFALAAIAGFGARQFGRAPWAVLAFGLGVTALVTAALRSGDRTPERLERD